MKRIFLFLPLLFWIIVSDAYSQDGLIPAFPLNKNNLEFRYAQANIHDHLDGGQSNCEIKMADNGKLQLIEHFQWSSREGSGTNVYEEL